MKLLIITEILDSLSVYDLEGSFEHMIEVLYVYKQKYPAHTGYRLSYQSGWNDENMRIEIIADRKESHVEWRQRLNKVKEKRREKLQQDKEHKKEVRQEAIKLGLIKE